MGVTVEIRDSDNSVEGILEVLNASDFPLSLTYGVADIKNIKPDNKRWRGGTFTKEFQLAGSHNNDVILQHIYDTNIQDSKEMKANKPCIIKVDGIPYMTGNFKVIDIETSKGVKTYKCKATGDNLVWSQQFNQLRLNQLSWGTHTYDITTIEASWSASDSDYYYGMVNYGQWDQGDQVSVEDMRPAIRIYSILSKAFTSIGYRLESTFLETAQFKNIHRLYTGTGFKHPQSTLDDNQYTATKTSDQVVNYGAKPLGASLTATINPIQFETTDNSGVFNIATETYTVGVNGRYSFEFSLDISAKQLTPFAQYIQIRNNGSVIEEIEIDWTNGTNTSTAGLPSVSDLIVKTNDFELGLGDLITASYRFEYETFQVVVDTEITIKIGTFFSNIMSPQFIEGISITLADQLPDTPIMKYISGITHNFNLYWKTNVAERTVTVEPFDNWTDIDGATQLGFFKGIANANDFTQDFDTSKVHKVGFLSEYKRELRYQYKDDPKDDFLKKVNEAVELSFGSYKHTFSDRFIEGEEPSENPTFAFTYYIKDTAVSKNNLSSESPLLGRLWKEPQTAGDIPEFDTDFEERIGYKNYATQGTVELDWEGSFITQIPSLLSYGDRAADLDLKYNGDDGLVSTYYASQLNVIEKGIFVNAFFKLNVSNIQKIENADLLREPLYISDPVELKGYYLINQITNVTPQNPGTYQFELIKFENQEPVVIDTGQTDRIGNGEFGEDYIYSRGLVNSNTPQDTHVFAEITLSGTNTAWLHVVMFDEVENEIKHVTIPG